MIPARSKLLKTRNLLILWLLSSLLFAFGYTIIKNDLIKVNANREATADHIGKTFQVPAVLDRNNQAASIDFTKADLTIIDFWYTGCPPCLTEMSKFNQLLKASGSNLSIKSISIDRITEWSTIFSSNKRAFSFFKNNSDSWEHLIMKSNDNPRLNNLISGDALNYLQKTYNSSTFPMYFVVDKQGKIIATPESAVNYIKLNLLGKSSVSVFLDYVFANYLIILFSMIIPFAMYSLVYWVVIVGLMWYSKRVTSVKH